MRKLFLLSIMLLTALMVSAQITVSPKMKKGTKKTYIGETTTTIQGQKSITLTMETLFEVTDVTSDGYIVDITLKNVKSDADPNDFTGHIFTLSSEMMKDIKTSYLTDKNGQVTKILNYEEVISNARKLVDKIFESVPLPQGMSLDFVKEQAFANMTEESLLKTVQINTNPMALNGKTIQTGKEEEYTLDKMGIKMKRTYTVNSDGSVQAVSTHNMQKEDIKELVTSMFEKFAPGQADMLKDQIDAAIANIKLEINDNTTYTFSSDGWVETLNSELSSTTIGPKTIAKTTLRLKK